LQVPLDEVKAAFAANVFGLLDLVQVRLQGHKHVTCYSMSVI
jgi:hypothetical protein